MKVSKIKLYLGTICAAGFIAISSFFYFTDTQLEGEMLWQLSQSSIGYRVYHRIYNHRLNESNKTIENNVSFNECSINAKWVKNESLSNLKSSFSFSNEKCPDIVNLHHDTYPLSDNGKDWFISHYIDEYPLTADKTKKNNYALTFEDNGFRVVTDSLDDHWIYIVSNMIMPKKYAVEFDYYSKTAIREQLQFDLFTSSLADRFRIISEYGEILFFDAVQRGYFLKRFYEKECKMPIGTTNHIRLEIDGNRVVYFVNNKKELSVTINQLLVKPGHLIVLFWNNEDKKPIDISISNFAIYTETGGN